MLKKQLHSEIVVIGAGPGGYAAAFRAADLGKKVTLIDKNNALGGVCLNHGCIPSKALLHISKILNDTQELNDLGIFFSSPKIDINKIRSWKNSLIKNLNKGIFQLAKVRNVDIIYGNATFVSDSQLIIETETESKTITFENCIIATGSIPRTIKNIPNNHPKIINSTKALEFDEIPKKLLIIGGGYIGLEMGSVFNAMGSSVTIVEFMDGLLPGADKDLINPLEKKLEKDFEKILLSTKVINIESENDTLIVHFENKTHEKFSEIFDTILISVGRQPNTSKIGIENTGILLDEKGFIIVDEKLRTNISHIYAIGDVVGNPMLAHKATHEGKIAAEVICNLPSVFKPALIPAVIFTDPEIAWAGPTENELINAGIKYEKGEFPWNASGKALAIKKPEGKTKLIFDKKTKKIISAGIVGTNAGDLIGEAILAIEMGATIEDISLSIHPHPTLTETIGNAAEMLSGTITDLYAPK
tara:strand:- start:130 stop:1548 length:1419 start_codon:yes stop_codon:yes gene_type:complete